MKSIRSHRLRTIMELKLMEPVNTNLNPSNRNIPQKVSMKNPRSHKLKTTVRQNLTEAHKIINRRQITTMTSIMEMRLVETYMMPMEMNMDSRTTTLKSTKV